MAFTSFTGVSDAARAIQDYLMDHGSDVPEELRGKLRDLVGPTTSPVDAVVNAAELIYARRADLSNDLLELGAGCAIIAQQYNFHGMAEDDRGTKIALSMMRQAGVEAPSGVSYPDEADDPAVKDQFAPTPEAPPEAAEENKDDENAPKMVRDVTKKSRKK